MLLADIETGFRVTLRYESDSSKSIAGTVVKVDPANRGCRVRWDEDGQIDFLHEIDFARAEFTSNRGARGERPLLCLCEECRRNATLEGHGFCPACVTLGCSPKLSKCGATDTATARVIAAMDKPTRVPCAGKHRFGRIGICRGCGAEKPLRAPRPPKYKAESSPPAKLPHGRRLASAGDVYAELGDIRAETREHFICFMLNVRHAVIARRVISIGTLTGVDVHPREVFRQAIIDGAAAVIFAHNHPSGDPSPSRQDIEITHRLREVGEVCGIPVLDHVVAAEGGFISLAERLWK